MREKQFQQLVLEAAQLLGWRAYHTFDSRRSQAGFPDLVLVRGGRLVFAELKTDDGSLAGDQHAWLNDLRQVAEAIADRLGARRYRDGVGVEVYTWRPSDWDQIHRVLSRPPRSRVRSAA